jgi:DNA polymerase-1
VDGNNLGFAGMGATRLHAGNSDTQSTFTVIRSIRRIYLENPDALVMVLWDGKSWRKDAFTEYKANREVTAKQVEEREAYYKQKTSIVDGLNFLGVMQSVASNMEADDLAEIYSSSFRGEKITLYSGDKDWLQLVDERTTWFDPIRDRQCTNKNFEAFTNCKNVKQFLERKYIEGDVGDNIKGLKGVGNKTLDDVYNIWNSLDEFYHDFDRQEKWKDAYGRAIPSALEGQATEAYEVMSKNETLMNLKTANRPEPINLRRYGGKLHEEEFKTFCYENAFISFVRDYDKFLKPFKENKFVQI